MRDAAADGAELVALPEKWNLLGGPEVLIEGGEPLDGPTITASRGWARELGIHLLAGSIAERVEGQEQLSNTSVLIGPDGETRRLPQDPHVRRRRRRRRVPRVRHRGARRRDRRRRSPAASRSG